MKFRYNEKRYSRIIACGQIMKDVASEIGLSQGFVLEHIRDLWKNVVGDIIATHSFPLKIANHILYIIVDHPIYANEITLSQSMIIKRLSELSSSIAIHSLKCTVKKNPSRKSSDVYSHR
ncbi:MAG: DUF721 domain-containing protein [Spirochaetes bacterium]|nr:DUF721 domain-containing protein [Spirochaetota bacterium]